MDSESKSQAKKSSLCVPVETRFASVLKPLVASICQEGQQNRKRTDIPLAIYHRVCQNGYSGQGSSERLNKDVKNHRTLHLTVYPRLSSAILNKNLQIL